MRPPARIVLVDDQPASSVLFRAGLEARPDLTIAAAVTCASCSFAAVSRHQPELVVLSLKMPGHRLLQLVKDLRVLHAGLKFLILSHPGAELEESRVLQAGALGCIPDSSSIDTRIDAVLQVLSGQTCFTPQLPARQPAAAAVRLSPLHWVNASAAL